MTAILGLLFSKAGIYLGAAVLLGLMAFAVYRSIRAQGKAAQVAVDRGREVRDVERTNQARSQVDAEPDSTVLDDLRHQSGIDK